jgi:hypothetical protein
LPLRKDQTLDYGCEDGGISMELDNL